MKPILLRQFFSSDEEKGSSSEEEKRLQQSSSPSHAWILRFVFLESKVGGDIDVGESSPPSMIPLQPIYVSAGCMCHSGSSWRCLSNYIRLLSLLPEGDGGFINEGKLSLNLVFLIDCI
ncbi:hypothetical protein EUTSA_v10022472mg [Eutrema salsugineum]|uniref:Uncharacterized protein n=1 Tax=Eutrema salsugineum TaxID=72664 RepID=V4LGE1_EUTSA|nr:hypothetical protein EUTSA_v10022472mg [Eutrema salsugineum]ESQ38852.1 hypothetical protein EUTSA_v10022472mg [Eutrema salsugineum]ESQ38853.1 hypothetical protein EUTSA_v10022472mg [Eutrema salsugineum]